MFTPLVPSAPVFLSPTSPNPPPPQPMPSTRSYSDAIDALNSLQNNVATLAAVRASASRTSDFAIPEMLEYLYRIGHSVSPGLALSRTDW